MIQAQYKKYVLQFKRPSGTSRGILTQKETWFLIVREGNHFGVGECGVLKGLSVDNEADYEEQLKWVCANVNLGQDALWEALVNFPSIQFGVEQAFISLKRPDPLVLFPSAFTDKERPIPINGLVWMGDEHFMHEQIAQKLKAGFRCIKMKIGAIDFETELQLLASIRKQYQKDVIELRVDANGAFDKEDALKKLEALASYDIHSIEQPIAPKNDVHMAKLCSQTPIPIALDEELIGITNYNAKKDLLNTIKPQYIILKPSLIGGYKGAGEWISLANDLNIPWWVTSALESNIGLNAIAQWTYTLNNPLPQGLGTGSLYTNNFDSPLTVSAGKLYYRKVVPWQKNLIAKLCT